MRNLHVLKQSLLPSAAYTALVELVEKDLNAKFEKDLLLEMEKITTAEKMAEDVK